MLENFNTLHSTQDVCLHLKFEWTLIPANANEHREIKRLRVRESWEQPLEVQNVTPSKQFLSSRDRFSLSTCLRVSPLVCHRFNASLKDLNNLAADILFIQTSEGQMIVNANIYFGCLLIVSEKNAFS